MTNLESLANELLLDLFEYLSTVHLLNAFHGVNHRFTTLLTKHFCERHLDFHFASKYDCKIICEQYLPLIVNRINSLRLVDNEDNSLQQTDLFFSRDLKLYQYTHLRLLSLCHIRIEQTMSQMIFHCCCLPHLSHLRLVKCRHISKYVFEAIWRLPKLTHCYLDLEQNDFHIPTNVSLSLEYLSILEHSCDLRQLAHIFEQTPRLRSLCMQHNVLNDDGRLTSPILLITTLKLYHVRLIDVMTNLLENMPNLCHLKVETFDIDLNGCQWKELIVRYLPRLNIFRLKMEMQFPKKNNDEQQIDNFLDTFRNEFWLEKHHWFVRCHWKSSNDHLKVLLYTLPQNFMKFDMSTMNVWYKSTYLHDNIQYSYHKVHSITYHPPSNTNLSFFHIGFSSIHHLSLDLPLDQQFWKIIPRLDYLTSLCISSSDNDAQNHLQKLLDQSPSLYTLVIKLWPSSQMSLDRNMSRSVRRLDLRLLELSDQRDSDPSFIIHKYVELGTFLPGIQCQILLISTRHVEHVLTLVNTMTNLRVLNITWPVNERSALVYDSKSFRIYNFIKTLRLRLPSTWIIENHKSGCNIYLEII